MIDIVVVDFGQTDSVDKLFLEHCTFNKIAEETLNFLFVWEGSIDFVWFFLERGHLAFDSFEVIFEIVQYVFQFLHDAICDDKLISESFQLFADFDIIISCFSFDDLQLSDYCFAHVS